VTFLFLASSPEKTLSNWCVPRFGNMVFGNGEKQEALLRGALPFLRWQSSHSTISDSTRPEQHPHAKKMCRMGIHAHLFVYGLACQKKQACAGAFLRTLCALPSWVRTLSSWLQQRISAALPLIGRCDTTVQDRLEGNSEGTLTSETGCSSLNGSRMADNNRCSRPGGLRGAGKARAPHVRSSRTSRRTSDAPRGHGSHRRFRHAGHHQTAFVRHGTPGNGSARWSNHGSHKIPAHPW
jgi:hypothetical protein